LILYFLYKEVPMVTDKERLGYVTLRQLAGQLGLKYERLYARLARGQFPPPSRRLPSGVRLYYSRDDVRRIVETYGVEGKEDER